MRSKQSPLTTALTLAAALTFYSQALADEIGQAFKMPGVGQSFSYQQTETGKDELTWTDTVKGTGQYNGQDVYFLEGGLGNRFKTARRIADGNFVGWMNDKGQPTYSGSPHVSQYKWPMTPGDSWNARYTWKDHGKGKNYSVKEAWEVIAYEEVTTPAGTFPVIKLEMESKSRTKTTWFSPSLGVEVKAIQVRKNGDTRTIVLTAVTPGTS